MPTRLQDAVDRTDAWGESFQCDSIARVSHWCQITNPGEVTASLQARGPGAPVEFECFEVGVKSPTTLPRVSPGNCPAGYLFPGPAVRRTSVANRLPPR